MAMKDWACGKCGNSFDTLSECDRHFLKCDGKKDAVNPVHYKSSSAHCTGCNKTLECIDVTRYMNFNLGNVIKYIWRAGLKGDLLEQLHKAQWYLNDEIDRLENKK